MKYKTYIKQIEDKIGTYLTVLQVFNLERQRKTESCYEAKPLVEHLEILGDVLTAQNRIEFYADKIAEVNYCLDVPAEFVEQSKSRSVEIIAKEWNETRKKEAKR